MNDVTLERLSVLAAALDDLYESLGELRLAIGELRGDVNGLMDGDSVTATLVPEFYCGDGIIGVGDPPGTLPKKRPEWEPNPPTPRWEPPF